MGTTVDAGAEDLRRLRVPEAGPVRRPHDHAVLDHLERVHRRMAHDGAVAVDVSFERVDGVQDEVRRNERAGAVVQHHVLELVRHVLEAGERGLLAERPRRRQHDGRHEREGVDGALQVFVHAVLRRHDDDQTDVAHRVEGLCGPGENGTARYLHQLLAAFAAEALARAAGQDDGSGLRLFVQTALQSAERLRQRVEVKLRQQGFGRFEHRRNGNGIDDLLRHGVSPSVPMLFVPSNYKARAPLPVRGLCLFWRARRARPG